MGTLSYPELEATIRLLLKKYHAEYALLFGSYARGEATPKSDLDFRIDKGQLRSLFQLSGMHGTSLLWAKSCAS